MLQLQHPILKLDENAKNAYLQGVLIAIDELEKCIPKLDAKERLKERLMLLGTKLCLPSNTCNDCWTLILELRVDSVYIQTNIEEPLSKKFASQKMDGVLCLLCDFSGLLDGAFRQLPAFQKTCNKIVSSIFSLPSEKCHQYLDICQKIANGERRRSDSVYAISPDILDYYYELDFARLPGTELLKTLARNPMFASLCQVSSWQELLHYIKNVNLESQAPVFWQKRQEILKYANLVELKKLSPDDYYALKKAMHWDWTTEFNWRHFSPSEIGIMIAHNHEFVADYGWENVTLDVLAKMAELDPVYVNENLAKIKTDCIVNLALSHSGLFSRKLAKEANLNQIQRLVSGNEVAAILLRRPEFEKYCLWKNVPAKEWVKLLSASDRYLSHCDFSKFTPEDWISLLNHESKYASYCKCWGSFTGEQWLALFELDKKFFNFCDYNWLKSKDWCAFLSKYPVLVGKCNWRIIESQDWLSLLRVNRDYGKHCLNWNIFSSSEWVNILSEYPEYSDNCNWEIIETHDWFSILKLDRTYGKHCRNWNRFSSQEWVKLLKDYPEYSNNCPNWNFSREEWIEILRNNSKYSEKCHQWNTFTSSDWVTLFGINPALFAHLFSDGNFRVLQQKDFRAILNEDYNSYSKSRLSKQMDWLDNMLTSNELSSFLQGVGASGDYYAIYCLRFAVNVPIVIKERTTFVDEYLDWNLLLLKDWLACFSLDPKYAAKCNRNHWIKMANEIAKIEDDAIRQSVKKVNEECWLKRNDIIKYVDVVEFVAIPREAFLTIVDFMDWEFDKHLNWSKFSNDDFIDLAKRHPDFLLKNGFDKFDGQQLAKLIRTTDQFNNCFSHDEMARILTFDSSLYSSLRNYFKLNMADRLFFRDYGIDQLRSKVAFYRLFVTQVVVFLFGWIFLYFGECGYKAFSGEHPKEAQTAMYVYVGFALVWSLVQAKLHEYCGKGILSRFLGITQGMFGVILFGYSFFLTNLTRPDYLVAIGIYGVYMLFMLFCHHCVAKKIMSGSWGV